MHAIAPSVLPCHSRRLTITRSLLWLRSPKHQWSIASTAYIASNTSPYGGDDNAGRPSSSSSLPIAKRLPWAWR